MTETEKQLNINAKFWQGKFQTARKQRNLLNQKISNLLIAIEEGKITVFPEDDLTHDYIQDLEDVQKFITKEVMDDKTDYTWHLRDAYLAGFEEGWERKEGGVSAFGISDELANRYVGR